MSYVDWADTMRGPRAYGAEILETLEDRPPTTRDEVDVALRALQDLRGSIGQAVDRLEVDMRRHDAELPRVARLRGDAARDRMDVEARWAEDTELADAIDAANEAAYRADLERRQPPIDEDPRMDRDPPGYDRRVFGGDEPDAPRRHERRDP